MQQLVCETGQDRKIAALNKMIVCTYFFKKNTKKCLYNNKRTRVLKKERGIIMNTNNIITYSVDKNLRNKLYLSVQNGEVLLDVPWYYTKNQIQRIFISTCSQKIYICMITTICAFLVI